MEGDKLLLYIFFLIILKQAGTPHDTANGGTVFIVSSDIFSYTGEYQARDGVCAIRSWAITNTSLISQARPVPCGPPY